MRTRLALQEALAEEIHATGDLSRVTVTGVTERADVTRRTFYSHYKDIPTLVACIEDEAVSDLVPLVQQVSKVTLPELEEAIHAFDPCPGATEILAYFREHGNVLSALLGEGGDPAFAERLKEMVREVVRRLDEARCMVVEEYPDRPDGTPCKDANEILFFHGAEALKATLDSAQPVPVKGILQ
jgi:AcrR family transcriptional regulator